MKISILTLFPEMFAGPFDHSIIKRAQGKKLVDIELVNIRDFGIGKHKLVDDTSYGGGAGMVLRVDVIDKTITSSKCPPKARLAKGGKVKSSKCKERVILLDPRGETFTQQKAKKFAKLDHLILIAGHYEGIDERVKQYSVDEAISIGDYILTGGEIPAMVVTDAVVRLIPGVIKKESRTNESFSKPKTLEYPQYTKPQVYENRFVPKILLSGNHKEIDKWRTEQSASSNKKIKA